MAQDLAVPPEIAALTPKQRAFVEKYLEFGGGTGKAAEAARAAGYAESGAAHQAHELLRNPRVIAALKGSLYARNLAAAIRAVERAEDLIESSSASDALKAIQLVLKLSEMMPDQKISVKHEHEHTYQTREEMLEKFTMLADQNEAENPELAKFYRKLVEDQAGKTKEVVDADFEVVEATGPGYQPKRPTPSVNGKIPGEGGRGRPYKKVLVPGKLQPKEQARKALKAAKAQEDEIDFTQEW